MKTLTTLFTVLLITLSFYISAQSTFQSYFAQGNRFTESYDVIATDDGGFLVTGTAMNASFNSDLYVIKIDQNGETDWIIQKDYDGGGFFDIGISAVEGENTFTILLYSFIDGSPTFGSLLIKVDKTSAEIIQLRNLIDVFPQIAFDHLTSNDDGTKLFLSTYDTQLSQGLAMSPLFVTQIDNQSLKLDWTQYYTNALSSSGSDFYFTGLEFSNNEIFIGTGGSNPDSLNVNFQSRKLTVSKTDSLGNQIWLNEIPDTRIATDIALTSTSLIASSDFNFSGEKGLLFSFDRATGDLEWRKSYEPYLETVAGCVVNTADEIMCSGNKDGGFVLIKVDKDGNLIWSKTTLPPSNVKSLQSRSVALTTDEGIAVTGNLILDGINGPAGIFIYRLNSEGEFGDIVSTQNNITFHNFDIDVFPNPTTDIVTIQNNATTVEPYQLTLYDLKGMKQHQTELSDHSTTINMQSYPSGAYILELRTAENQILHKTIVRE